MDIVKARTLRPYERRKLNAMKHQLTNAVNRRHARIILLSRGGNPNHRIAEQCDCSTAWVRQLIHRFNDGGIDGIYWSPCFCGPTGPTKFAVEITEQIGEIALSPPKQLIGMSVWTPTNALWLNRIECHFTALKKCALDNTDYRSHAEQQEAIEHYLSWRNRKRDISMQD